MKQLLLFLFSWGFAFSSYSQTYAVKIIDLATNQPIKGITLKIITNNSAKAHITDEFGTLTITENVSSDSKLEIIQPGFMPYIQTFNTNLSNQTIFLTPSVVTIDEVVISANKFEEKKDEVPRQIKVINSTQIASANQQNIADVLQNSGEVFLQKSQMGGGSPIIRGFEANKVLLVVDGIRMNNAIYRGGHLQNVLRIDQNNLERTEILFGTGSVIYGSDALGGVVHFYTQKPQLSSGLNTLFKVKANSSYASVNNYINEHVDFNIGFKKLAFYTGLSYSLYGDLKQGSNRSADMGNLGLRDSIQSRINGKDVAIVNPNKLVQTPGGYSQIDVMQKVLYAPSKNIEHILNIQYSTSSDVPRYDRLTEISSKTGTFNSAEWYYGPEKRLLTAYQFNINKPTVFYNKLNLNAAYQNIEESRHNRSFNSNNKTNRNEQVGIYSINIDAEKKINKHELRYGVEYTFNEVKSTANKQNILTGALSPQSTRYPDGGSTMKSFGIYLNHAIEINKKLILNEGIRYSLIQLDASFIEKTFFPYLDNSYSQRNSALSGQIGLVFKPQSSLLFSVIGSTGFRAPNVDDLGKTFESAGGDKVVIPNPSVKPEMAYTIEFRASKLVAQKIQIGGGYWYTLIKDAIVTLPTQLNGQDSIVFDSKMTKVVSNQNNQTAYIQGMYGYLNIDFTKHLMLSNNINYTYGRTLNNGIESPLDHIAPLFGKSMITYICKQLRTDFYVNYNGQKSLSDYNLLGEDNLIYATKNGMPSWYTLNLQTAYSYNVLKVQSQIQIGVENILDRNYRVFASGISAPGRNLFVTLRVKL